MKHYNIAVVGATGMVGRTMLQVLQERQFPIDNLYLFASAKSAGQTVRVNGKDYTVEELNDHSFDRPIDIALFSAGGNTSLKYAPIAAQHGCIVVDNSSAWRMDNHVPLVVPEVNANALSTHQNIIANPNCSTIQSVVPLKPLHDKYGVKRVIYATYQAVSGAGIKGYDDLKNGLDGAQPKQFQHQIANNVIPHIDVFLDNGYTKEEVKMIEETKKILNDQNIAVTATTVRVPVYYGHSVAINIELEKPFDDAQLLAELNAFDGLTVIDQPADNAYPMPVDIAGKDEVYIGRIRRDYSVANGVNLWCVADNIRKGAATNAVQIAEKLVEFGL